MLKQPTLKFLLAYIALRAPLQQLMKQVLVLFLLALIAFRAYVRSGKGAFINIKLVALLLRNAMEHLLFSTDVLTRQFLILVPTYMNPCLSWLRTMLSFVVFAANEELADELEPLALIRVVLAVLLLWAKQTPLLLLLR